MSNATEASNLTEVSNATEYQIENESKKNLSTYFDPHLMAIFRERQTELKEAMKEFMVSKKELDVAKLSANLAMKKLRMATEKRRKILMSGRMMEMERRRALKQEHIQAKQDLIRRGEEMLGGAITGFAAGVNLSFAAEMLLALPEALEDQEFMEDFRNSTKQVDKLVRKFLDHAQTKTNQFVKESTSASDVELRFVMAKYFHESSFKLRALHQDTLRQLQKLRRTVPEDLERSMFPFLGQLNTHAVHLRINATSLATATPKETCLQVTDIMANISDYDNKLQTVNKVIENVTAIIPQMSEALSIPQQTADFVESFLNMARLEVGGLQEAAHSMVQRASPIITDRVQCTFSGARPRFGLSAASALAVLVSTWLLL